MEHSPFLLNNKTFLVTGASSGIGKQTSITLSSMGADVIITGRNKERLSETFNSLIGKSNQYINADLLIESDINKLVTDLPKLDGIVHCAGIVTPYPIQFLSEEKIQDTFQVNYNMPVKLMAAITRKNC